ncbi:MAG TPA: type III-B CRISPR module RAMP protein Cmr4 [Chitinophagales bacterium]|nr:type III-B CRISPR module RAMP protein Cmr4 [Chitinophagales bacterium]
MATTFTAYFIQCITNLHAGSGDTNYSIIDKSVQRDPITNYPTIHASSLKGALREHFENNSMHKVDIDAIFGKEGKDGTDSESGTHRFLNADLVALPVRCTHKQFALGFDKTSSDFVNTKAVNILGKDKKIFSLTVDEETDKIYGNATGDVYAEDIKLIPSPFANPFGIEQQLINDQFATFQNKNFETLTKNLPVIARNRLGENNNLWYEEIVPHQTIFITFIGASEEDDTFNTALTSELIQIGANASVGYGLCKFIKINL